MEKAMLQQRIKYLIEEGGLYPQEAPIPRDTMLKIAVAILGVEVLNLIATIVLVVHR